MKRMLHRPSGAVVLSVCIGVCTPMARGGPVIIAGHDPDDHGLQAIYASLFTVIRAQVSNGNNGILAIGADSGATAGLWINQVAGMMTPPQTVTFVNDAAIATVNFGTFAILHIPSDINDVTGGISATENATLAGRAIDVANFVNGGGGLFGLTQGQIANAYAYLGAFAAITAQPVPNSGVCNTTTGQAFDDISATPAGMLIGINNTNLDGCCWHNTFTTFPAFLSVLATVNEPGCPTINGQAAVLGGNITIPGQLALAPVLDFNPPGTSHTVTATAVQATPPNNPLPNVVVTFTVMTGPNAGQSGMGTTNAMGQASFTFTSNNSVGVDRIRASFFDAPSGTQVLSNTVQKFWDLNCNANPIPDTCDIGCGGFGGACTAFSGCGGSTDANGDGIPDECVINHTPVALCHNVTVNADVTCHASASVNNGSFDPDGPPFTIVETPPGPYPLGMTTVTLTITDPANASATCTGVVTVVDATPPGIACPASITVNCSAPTDPAHTGSAMATDNCDTTPTITHTDSITPGACPQAMTITRTWRAADDAGNSSSCTQTITVQDQIAPMLSCPARLTVQCDGAGNTAALAAWLGGASASDTCGRAALTNNFSGLTDGCGASGAATVTWTATDPCGNSATCSSTFTVADTAMPSISCPAAQTVQCDGSGNTAALNDWLASATASDVCGAVTMTNNFAGLTDGCGASGLATVTWTATDACGHTATCSSTFAATDTAAPSISCPAAQTVQCDGSGNTAALNAWLASATASDACGAATVTNNFAGLTDGCGGSGLATVTWTATDVCGHTATCSSTFAATDTAVPSISCPAAQTVQCDGSGNTAALNAWLASATAGDACGAVTMTNNFTGLSDDCGASGSTTVTWTATDACGQPAMCSSTFTSIDASPPAINCPADITVACGGSTDPGATGTASANDTCDAAPAVAFQDAVNGATITRTWRSTDACGNSSSCVQTISAGQMAVRVDIKPGSCPNGFNPGLQGVLPVAVCGTGEFDVHQVDPASVRIARADGVGTSVAPIRHVFSDVATPFAGTPCDCHTLHGDGIVDLSVKFSTPAVAAALQLGTMQPGQSIELIVTGALTGGCAFGGTDCVTYVPGQ